MSGAICVLSCGARKQPDGYHAAIDLYVGPYFKKAKAWALSRFAPDDIYIISAKHGLIRHDFKLCAYDQRMGRPGSVTVDQVRRQATRLGVLNRGVVLVGGSAYRRVCDQVWPTVFCPFADAGGIGSQMGAMTRATEPGTADDSSRH